MHTATDAVRDYRARLYPRQQVKAAEDAGISQPYLSQLEQGRRRLTAETAWKIEEGWGLERNELADLVRSERAQYSRRHQRKEVVPLSAFRPAERHPCHPFLAGVAA